MKHVATSFLVIIIALAWSCAPATTGQNGWPSVPDTPNQVKGPPYPETAFMVFSDPHLFDPALGVNDPAWNSYVKFDRKTYAQSLETVRTVIDGILKAHPSFVIIPGDLTKDGEKHDHELMASELRRLKDAGIAVYVVPGNHDMLNPNACRFVDGKKERVDTVTPAEFAGIYADFGYGDALDRDLASLSYVAEPVPGLLLLCVDSTLSDDNLSLGHTVTAGLVRQETKVWIRKWLIKAEKEGTAVVAMHHHGVLEHFAGQTEILPDYVLRNYRDMAELYASYNVRLVFTGHFHANDITGKWWNSPKPADTKRDVVGDRFEPSYGVNMTGKFLFDIETGSLVTMPYPYRTVRLHADGSVEITTRTVTQLPSFDAKGASFSDFARDYVVSGMSGMLASIMKRYLIPDAEAKTLSGQITAALLAHYAGDEHFIGTPEEMLQTESLSLVANLLISVEGHIVRSLWKDLPPADNDVLLFGNGGWARFTGGNLETAVSTGNPPGNR